MAADDIEVIHMTAVEYDRALQASLDKLGLTWEQLTAQAAARDFSSLEARQLWLTAGGQGPNQADVEVERLQADLRAAYAERDQQFERKCEALRERDEARRELAELREVEIALNARKTAAILEAMERAEQAEADREEEARSAVSLRRERDVLKAELAEARAAWSDWRGRLGGSFPRAMVQELSAALSSRPDDAEEIRRLAQATTESTED